MIRIEEGQRKSFEFSVVNGRIDEKDAYDTVVAFLDNDQEGKKWEKILTSPWKQRVSPVACAQPDK